MKEKIVRCNWCEHILPEDELYTDEEVEFCPDCNTAGHLMDLGTFGVDTDETLFPNLTKSKDWETLKRHFSVNTLCYFENEVHDYEYGVGNEDVEDYPTIVQWWEGLMYTSELIETYA